jgi:REP element-mobilizing transposase RayT
VALPDYLTIKGKALQCQILKVGVHQNHVHFVISIPPNFSIIKIINIIKENSFKYLKNNIKNVNFHWAKGFYISTISPTELQNTFKLFPVDNNIDDNVQLMEEVVNFLKI